MSPAPLQAEVMQLGAAAGTQAAAAKAKEHEKHVEELQSAVSQAKSVAHGVRVESS